MTSNPSPERTPKSLAMQLRGLRRTAGVSQAEMAERMSRTQSWISLIERGQIHLTVDVIERWCDLLQVTPEVREIVREGFELENDKYETWREFWTRGADCAQDEIGNLEMSAQRIRVFQPSAVFGLLQTPQYAEAIYYATRAFADDSQLPNYIRSRLARQAVLHDPSKSIEIIHTEAALRTQFAHPSIMAKQLDHIARLSERGMVDIGILPFADTIVVNPYSNWEIYDNRIAAVELLSGRVTFTEQKDLTTYVDAFELLWDEALVDDEARQFLWTIAREYEKYESLSLDNIH